MSARLLPAFADMGGPELIGYSVTVNKETEYFSWDWDDATNTSSMKKAGVLPAGTELNISGEYTLDTETYGSFYIDRGFSSLSGYVRLRDLKTEDKPAYPKEAGYKQSIPVRLRITAPDGVDLYAGPSASYAKVGSVPKGAELTVDTLDQSGYSFGAWMYMSRGGQSGWARCWLYDGVSCPAAELLPQGQTGTVWVVKNDAVLKDAQENALITVPKGEKLQFNAYNRTAHTLYFYVTYKGKTGWFQENDDGYDNYVASNCDFFTSHTIRFNEAQTYRMYAYPDDKLPIGSVRFAADETVEWDYMYYSDPIEGERGGEEWYSVEKDGKQGWIKPEQRAIEFADTNDSAYSAIPELFGSESVAHEEYKTAPATTAAASSAPAGATASETESALTTDMQTTEEPAVSAFIETAETTSDTQTVSFARPVSPGRIIGVCIAAAAILALTAFVTLRLLRRKQGG